MADLTADQQHAYQRLEEAIKAVAQASDFAGVLTEWVVVIACQSLDEDGDGVTQVGTLLPDGGGRVPYHRMMGLLDYALTRSRAEICED